MRKWIVLSAFCAVLANGQALTQTERDAAVAQLKASRQAFLDSVAGLSPAQLNFKASPERWSVAECAEHITVSEEMILNLIQERVMKTPATPEKHGTAKFTDEGLVTAMHDRSHKAKAPEQMKPTNRWPDVAAMVEEFKTRRGKTIEYAETTTDALRDHFLPHPAFGPLDGYQWVLLLSSHSERHTAQINEVKADPNFPKS